MENTDAGRKIDMELKRLHMGTMAYGPESIEEINSHLESALSQGADLCPLFLLPKT
jgi:hypothetical protein